MNDHRPSLLPPRHAAPGSGLTRRAPGADRITDPVARVGIDDPWRLIFWARYIGLPLLAVLTFFSPLELDGHQPLAAVLIVLMLVATFTVDRLRHRHPHLTLRLVEADVVTSALLVAVAPTAIAGVVLVLLADIALVASAAGRDPAVRATVLGSIAMFIASLVSGRMTPDLVIFLVVAAVVAVVVGNLAEGQRELRRASEHLVHGIHGIVWTLSTQPPAELAVAGAHAEILGLPASALASPERWITHIHPDDRPRFLSQLQAVMTAPDEPIELEYRMLHADGSEVTVRDTLRGEAHGTAKPHTVRGLVVDVTHQRRTEQDLGHHRDIFEHIHTALVVVRMDDPDDPKSLTLIAANPAAARILGRDGRDQIGARLTDVFPILRDGPIPSRLADTIRSGIGFDKEMALSDSPDAPVFSVHTFPLPDRSVTMALQDVTDRTRVQERLRHQALHDALTGLPNRVLLNDRLRQALELAHRTSEPLAIMIMDLNHFKEVNDTLGHHSGDVLLTEIAHRLRESLREADTVARLGGDEFAILLSTDATRSGASAVAEKIGRVVERPVEIDDVSIQVSASIGIAFFPEHATDADGLARRADVAMYVAKRSNSTYALYAPEDDRSSIRRLTLLGELRQAITANQLVLHHQPTIELSTGRVLRTEALLRWRHPEHGLMPPGEFMELAEMSGVVQPLTRWVLRQSIRQVRQLTVDGEFLHVAVNISARNLYEPDLIDWLVNLLESERFPGERLTLEITESLLMDDPLLALGVLRRLKTFGISLSVDDFGTGYSSLSYLRDLPIDEIKIDQSFVAAMALPGGDDTIVRSVIDLGHNLGLAVVAEGVEDVETLVRLRDMGCDRAQGFVLSQPLPAEDLAGLLQTDWFARFASPQTPPEDW